MILYLADDIEYSTVQDFLWSCCRPTQRLEDGGSNTAMTQAGALATVPGGQTAYYPEEYGNNDGPLFAAAGQLYSFPVMPDGSAWNCKFYMK
jgi:hypothetical protein